MDASPRTGAVRDGMARSLAALVNRLLATDSTSSARLARLEGRAIVLASIEPAWTVLLRVQAQELVFAAGDADLADVTIRGRPADFVALAKANQRGESLAAGRLEITGDLAIAQEVQGLLRELDIDIDALLANYVGDVAAHRIGRGARHLGVAGKQAADRFEADLAAWLKHELRAVPERHELEGLAEDARALADDVDRLAARIARLRQERGQ